MSSDTMSVQTNYFFWALQKSHKSVDEIMQRSPSASLAGSVIYCFVINLKILRSSGAELPPDYPEEELFATAAQAHIYLAKHASEDQELTEAYREALASEAWLHYAGLT